MTRRIPALMGVFAFVCLTGSETCRADKTGYLRLYGTISKVEVSRDGVVLTFKGIGRLYRKNPVYKERNQGIALYDTKVHMTLTKHVDTYIKFRYVETLTKAETIAMLKRSQANQTEVLIGVSADELTYSSSPLGFRAARIKGTSVIVAEWKSMFRDSIAERHKKLGIDYKRIINPYGDDKSKK